MSQKAQNNISMHFIKYLIKELKQSNISGLIFSYNFFSSKS